MPVQRGNLLPGRGRKNHRPAQAQPPGQGDPRHPRQANLHDLPRAHGGVFPHVHHRQPDQRMYHAPHHQGQEGEQGHHPGNDEEGGHRQRGKTLRPVPPRVFGRDAPARPDRHGAGVQAPAADRRRTHHRPGRDHPGADIGADAAAAERNADGHSVHHPRPGHRGQDVRPGGGHVSGPHRGNGHRPGNLQSPPAPLHPGPDGQRAQNRQPQAGPAVFHRGHRAPGPEPETGLRLL